MDFGPCHQGRSGLPAASSWTWNLDLQAGWIWAPGHAWVVAHPAGVIVWRGHELMPSTLWIHHPILGKCKYSGHPYHSQSITNNNLFFQSGSFRMTQPTCFTLVYSKWSFLSDFSCCMILRCTNLTFTSVLQCSHHIALRSCFQSCHMKLLQEREQRVGIKLHYEAKEVTFTSLENSQCENKTSFPNEWVKSQSWKAIESE